MTRRPRSPSSSSVWPGIVSKYSGLWVGFLLWGCMAVLAGLNTWSLRAIPSFGQSVYDSFISLYANLLGYSASTQNILLGKSSFLVASQTPTGTVGLRLDLEIFPLALTIAFWLLAVYFSWLAEKIAPSPRMRRRLLSSLISTIILGLGFLLTLLVSSTGFDRVNLVALGSGSVRVEIAWGRFFLVLLILWIATFLARLRAGRTRNSSITRSRIWWAYEFGYLFLVWGIYSLVVGLIAYAVIGLQYLGAAWVPGLWSWFGNQVVLGQFIMSGGNLFYGVLVNLGGFHRFSLSHDWGVFTEGWLWVMLVVQLIITVLVSVRVAGRRPIRTFRQARIYAWRLPLMLAISSGAAVYLASMTLRVDVWLDSVGAGQLRAYLMASVFWAAFLGFIWGVLVEILAAYFVPFLARKIPLFYHAIVAMGSRRD